MRPTTLSVKASPVRAGRTLVAALLVIALLASLGAWRQATAAAAAAKAQAARPTAVALVDLERLINSLDVFNNMRDRIEPYRAKLQSELTEMRDKLQSMDSEYEMLPESATEQRVEMLREMRKLDAMAQQLKPINEQLINLRQGDELYDIYQSVLASVQSLAEREGYDMIIVDDRNVRVPLGRDAGTIQSVISRKRILYANGAVDITDQLITAINGRQP